MRDGSNGCTEEFKNRPSLFGHIFSLVATVFVARALSVLCNTGLAIVVHAWWLWCAVGTKASCQAAAADPWLSCLLNNLYGIVNAKFLVTATAGTYTLAFTTVTGAYVVTSPIPFGATAAMISSAISATAVELAFALQDVVKNTTADGFSLSIMLVANASAAPVAQLNAYDLVPALGTFLTAIVTTVTAPVPIAALTATSQCCQYKSQLQAACSGWNLQDPMSPDYAFQFTVASSAARNYGIAYAATCPSKDASCCARLGVD